MNDPQTSSPPRATGLLRIFGEVRPGEAATLFLMTIGLFLLLVAYYLLKTIREPLILATGGAELKAYASAVQAVTLMGFVPLYAWVASRSDRRRLVTFLLAFFVVHVELFNLGLRYEMPNLGFVFFVWVGIFSLATIAQFWSFANDLYERSVGERLFPLIAIGATGGGWVGSKLAEEMFSRGVAPADMMHLAAGLLVVHLALFWLVERREAPSGAVKADPKSGMGRAGGFQLVFSSRYLLLIGGMLILLNVVNTNGEYIVSQAVTAAAEAAVAADPSVDAKAFIGTFYGSYYFYVNLLAVVLQAFVASRIVARWGTAGVVLTLPIVALGAYGLIGSGVGFAVLRWAKTAENATDYSIMNTGRQMLWLPTTTEQKYKAKQAIDTFFVRAGDLLSAGLFLAGSRWLGLGAAGFARLNVVVTIVWLVVAWRLLRENARLAGQERG